MYGFVQCGLGNRLITHTHRDLIGRNCWEVTRNNCESWQQPLQHEHM